MAVPRGLAFEHQVERMQESSRGQHSRQRGWQAKAREGPGTPCDWRGVSRVDESEREQRPDQVSCRKENQMGASRESVAHSFPASGLHVLEAHRSGSQQQVL